MRTTALILSVLAVVNTGCTSIYDGNGGRLAQFIGTDAEEVTLTRSANGAVTFAASSIKNSPTIEAVGGILKTGVMTWGAVAAIKQADDTVNAFTGNHLKR